MREQPELTVEEVPTADLVPYARNAKLHGETQVQTIVESIKEFGFNDPIAVWHNPEGEMEIVEGHGRVLAAKKLKLDAVPVVCLDHLSDEQRRAYTHVHNQTTLNSGFDVEVLDKDITELGFDWEAFGFAKVEPFDAFADLVENDFCENVLDVEKDHFAVTFTFPIEVKEAVGRYLKERGKDEIAEQIAMEAESWG